MRRLVLPLVLLTLAAAGCGGGGSGSSSTTTATSTEPATTSGCADVTAPDPRADGNLKAPTTKLDAAKRWTLTFRTSCGTFVVVLEPKTSPNAAASLVSLAKRGFFDDTIIHRIVPGFILQGGDPTQSGSGGPGYTTVDTPGSGTRYAKGVVAMAKTETEPRGAAGSQFFVMTADAPSLPADYAVVGRVVSGMPVVARIGELGDAADPAGTPTKTVVVDTVTAASS